MMLLNPGKGVALMTSIAVHNLNHNANLNYSKHENLHMGLIKQPEIVE